VTARSAGSTLALVWRYWSSSPVEHFKTPQKPEELQPTSALSKSGMQACQISSVLCKGCPNFQAELAKKLEEIVLGIEKK